MSKKIDVEYATVGLEKIRESDINPQVMKDGDFKRLVASLKKDGKLTSTVLLFEESSEKYRCISGHHRIKAARKAGITQVPSMIIKDADELTLTRLQLQHNDIHGEPNKEIVAELQNILNVDDASLVDFWGEKFFEKETEGLFDVETINYEHIRFCLLPDDKRIFEELLSEFSFEDEENYLIEKEDYIGMKMYLTQAFKAGYKTPGKALSKMIEVVNNHREDWQKRGVEVEITAKPSEEYYGKNWQSQKTLTKKKR